MSSAATSISVSRGAARRAAAALGRGVGGGRAAARLPRAQQRTATRQQQQQQQLQPDHGRRTLSSSTNPGVSSSSQRGPASEAEFQLWRRQAEQSLGDLEVQTAFLRRMRAGGRDAEAVEHIERHAEILLATPRVGAESGAKQSGLVQAYADALWALESKSVRAVGETESELQERAGRVMNRILAHTTRGGATEGAVAGVSAATAGAGEAAAAEAASAVRAQQANAAAAKLPGGLTPGGLGAAGSQANPLHVTTIPSKWQMFGSVVYFVVLGGLVYTLFFRQSGGGGGLGNLVDNKDFVAVEADIPTRFADVRGSHEAKEAMSELVDYLKFPERFTKAGAKLPKGVLLTGPPGCGKTLLARAVAGEANVPFFFASGSEFEEMFVGVGARRVRNLFKKAKAAAPCIVFIDEIDAVGGRRDQNENRTKMTLNQLLVELDGFDLNSGVLVIAATNLPEVLDPALIRPGRFDKQVLVDMPDVRARREILELYLGNPKINDSDERVGKVEASEDVDLDHLARTTMGFSGADLANLVNLAAIEAAKSRLAKVTGRLLDLARETISMGPARKNMAISPEVKRITAYHESGHALIALLSADVVGTEIVKATLLPRGQALGMVSYLPKDEHLRSKQAMLAELDIAMGGRVAEEMIFGRERATQGASSDFNQATRIARRMVMEFGMSEKVGPIVLKGDAWRDASEELKATVEEEVKRLLDESYERSQEILRTNEKKLHLLAENLLEYETLTLEDIKLVTAGKDIAARRRGELQREQELIEQEREKYGEEEAAGIDIEDEDDDDDEEGNSSGEQRRPQPSALR